MMPINAPLTGGSSPSANRFLVDGDFSICEPCSLPEISYPFQGDSVFSRNDIVVFDSGSGMYIRCPLGTYPNFQPWSPNQAAVVLTQDFMVGQEFYIPEQLNAPYNPAWADGLNLLQLANQNISLENLYLVKCGDLVDMGGGICKLRATWASIPLTRNEVESFTYSYPGFLGSTFAPTPILRQPFQSTVISRLQYDYFIFDDFAILAGIVSTFPLGARLNSVTGIYPDGLILPATRFYQPVADAVANNYFLDPSSGLSDQDVGIPASTPSYSDYLGFMGNDPAELIAESSTMNRWMGNIFERRTRFVIAQ